MKRRALFKDVHWPALSSDLNPSFSKAMMVYFRRIGWVLERVYSTNGTNNEDVMEWIVHAKNFDGSPFCGHFDSLKSLHEYWEWVGPCRLRLARKQCLLRKMYLSANNSLREELRTWSHFIWPAPKEAFEAMCQINNSPSWARLVVDLDSINLLVRSGEEEWRDLQRGLHTFITKIDREGLKENLPESMKEHCATKRL